MITTDTTRWIRWHAGLAAREAGAAASVTACIGTRDATDADLGAAVSDLLEAIGRLNVEFNGSVPSESPAVEESVPREIAYAVAELDRMLRQAADRNADRSSVASTGAWQLETAWLAVLAGDVDDIRDHLAEEAAMREQ